MGAGEGARWWKRMRFWRAIAGMAVACALASAIVAVEFSAELSTRTERFRKRTARQSQTIKQLTRELEGAERRVVDTQRDSLRSADLERVLFAADLRRLRLVPVAGRSSASGMIAVSESAAGAVVRLAGLPPTPKGQVYVLWWQPRDGEFTRAAEFAAGTDGAVAIAGTVPAEAKGLRRCIVTLEPAPGTSSPSGEIELRCAAVR
jgi:hypothetical protein